MSSLREAWSTCQAFSFFFAVLFLDKVLAASLFLVSFALLITHASGYWIVLSAALGAFLLGVGYERVRDVALFSALPVLTHYMGLKPDWCARLPADAFLMVYLCMPQEEHSDSSAPLLHQLFCRFAALYFTVVGKLSVENNGFGVSVCPRTTYVSRDDERSELDVDRQTRQWTLETTGPLVLQTFSSSKARFREVYVCSLVFSRLLTAHDWNKSGGASVLRVRMAVHPSLIYWTPESAAVLREMDPALTAKLRPWESQTLALTGKVIKSLLEAYNSGIHDLVGGAAPDIAIESL